MVEIKQVLKLFSFAKDYIVNKTPKCLTDCSNFMEFH